MSANDKFGLGYGDYRYGSILSYENKVLQSVFVNKKSDLENTSVNDRYAEGMHAVPPPMTGNYMPSGHDVEIDYSKFTYGPNQTSADESDSKPVKYASSESDSSVETTTFMPAPVDNAPKIVCEPKDDPHKALKDKEIVNSGCSRHMTGNKAHLADYQEFKGCSIAFGGSNGRITGKRKIKADRFYALSWKPCQGDSLNLPDHRSNSASFKTQLRFVSRRCCVLPKKTSCVLLKDTRPPMLDRTDFASGQQRIRLYCQGKDNRVNILKSIDEGPYKLGTFRETLAESTEGTPQFGPDRPRVYSDLNSKEKDRLLAFCLKVTAFCFKTKLSFASRPSAFYSRTYCDLSQEDTRPPMLDRTDFTSWQQRIRLYCRGKDNGVNILKSIDEGPYKLGTFRETLTESTEGIPQFGLERPLVYSDLNSKEIDWYNANIRATNILLQGLPKDIYTLINHYTDTKDIWDNVKMLLEGSKLTKEDRESQLYDDFEHFRQHKEESINGYYVRFSKLINDMRNIKMTMPKLQLNSKFVNNMLPEWGRFVTAVKLNRLFAYLKQHEAHAKENKMVLERLSQPTAQPTTDPLALLSNVSNIQHGSPSSSSTSSITPLPPPRANSTNDLIKNLTSTLALLTQSYRTFLPQTNNQLRTSSNPRRRHSSGYGEAQNRVGNVNQGQARPGQTRTVKCYNCNGTGNIAQNCTQPKRPQNSEYFKDKMLLMQAQENGVTLDAEQLLFLA
nr:hypothetical protein [Tanacetum cinerariifolium]